MSSSERMKKYASLLMIFLMVGSTLTYAILQSFGTSTEPESNDIEIPDSSIISYKITDEQKSYMIKRGVTILEYRYELACNECSSQRAYLGSVANEFEGSILLEEIVDNSVTNSTLTVTSYYGEQQTSNLSEDGVMNILCELMSNPPVTCATRNI